MSIGLLIITNDSIGQSLLQAATTMLGTCPLATKTLSIKQDCDPEKDIALANKYVQELDTGKGVLILTDMYGSTPSNIACTQITDRIKAVAGINLPMLVRLLNYPNLEFPQLLEKATTGGMDGVVECRKQYNND